MKVIELRKEYKESMLESYWYKQKWQNWKMYHNNISRAVSAAVQN